MQKLQRWILSLFFLGCIVAPPLRSNSSAVEQEALAIAKQKYPSLQKIPLAIFLVSTDNCAGCSAIAINHAITALHEKQPRLPCIVAVITSTSLEAVTIGERFFTPYIVADTLRTHINYALSHSTSLPQCAVFDNNGRLVFRQEDIQHHAPDYAAIISGITIPNDFIPDALHVKSTTTNTETTTQIQEKSVADVDDITLEEPATRSVRDIICPVVTDKKFTGINYLTGQLEQWDITNGKIYAPIKVPDTVMYFYRRSSHDRAWSSIQKQGYEMARFEALAAVDDTLYALVKVLTGYTIDTVMRKSTSGTLSPVSIDKWQPGQIIVRMEQGKVKSIVPVPDAYTLLAIAGNGHGYIGGVCSNALMADTSAGDSVAYVIMINRREIDTSPSVATWKIANTGSVFSAGALATAPGDALWYCDPMQSKFFRLHHNGTHNSFALQGTVRKSGSPIRLLPQPSDNGEFNTSEQPQFSYVLNNMITKGDTLFMFLIPENPASGLSCLLQLYTNTGQFLGERTLRIPMLQEALWIHLLTIEHDNALIALNTQDKHWHIKRVTFDGSPLSVPVLRSESTR